MTESDNLDFYSARSGLRFSEVFKAMKSAPNEFNTYAKVASIIEAYFEVGEMTLKLSEGEIVCKIKGDSTQVGTRGVQALAQTASAARAGDVPDYPPDYKPYQNSNPNIVCMDDIPAQMKALEETVDRLTRDLAAERAKIESALAVDFMGIDAAEYIDDIDLHEDMIRAGGYNAAIVNIRKRLTTDD